MTAATAASTTGVGAGAIAFTLLGPVSASVGGEHVTIDGRRQRVVLSLLVLARGRIVPLDTLADAVWGDRPPLSARTQIVLCVRALRKAFRAAGHTGHVIVTAHQGYRLRAERADVDVRTFDALVTAADEAAGEGEPAEAGTLYKRALDLWSGPALQGVGGRVTEEEAARLEERRLAAYEALLGIGETQLATGFFDEAEGTLLDALGIAERTGDPLLVAEANLVLGRFCRMLRRTVRAGQYLAVAHRAFRATGSEQGQAQVSVEMAMLAECVAASGPPLDAIPRQLSR
ncbi:BTAD domain-containing putative transcriptional regulator [Streptomyces sp. NPDC026206]|uniref:AfsR/SARP family transcriptional regulator n=1 Tax=Streptomyces sp. NPDC026206 TaxID=3157089 RepID=UPI0033FB526A